MSDCHFCKLKVTNSDHKSYCVACSKLYSCCAVCNCSNKLDCRQKCERCQVKTKQKQCNTNCLVQDCREEVMLCHQCYTKQPFCYWCYSDRLWDQYAYL